MSPPTSIADRWVTHWRRVAAAAVRAFHAYANWLVGISWKRFAVLSVLLLVGTAILESLPPFSWRITETVLEPHAPKPPAKPKTRGGGVDISIDERGVRITDRDAAASAPPAASAASGASAASAASAAGSAAGRSINIEMPADISDDTREAVREALQAAKEAIQEIADAQREAEQAKNDARRDIEQAKRDVEQAKRDVKQAQRDIDAAARDAGIQLPRRMVERTRTVRWGDFLPDLALLWIVASIIIKATYKGRMQAEVKAAMATETAEAESLKRQVVEARMAAMQAQVEPHFLFNTLASIDHLIETDPSRASTMQKNLIALLRASMPSMREANASGVRDLKRELEVIRPYLEILKVRMEERLHTTIDVPDGLLSAEFPPMMLQSLVENAIKHGLEPKAEGGALTLRAEIAHGKLVVSVTDTGLGFGLAPTAGTGVGLANIRERLALLYGSRASFVIAPHPGGGTRASITVPYRSLEGAAA